MIIRNFVFPSAAFALFFCFSTSFVPAQTDPVKNLSVDMVATRNFEITMERSSEHPRPTAKEVGVLVERLCAQLDKIFLRYAPHRVADELERLKKAEAEGKKPSALAKKEYDIEDPDRIIPKCRIFIFNDRNAYNEKCRFDGIEEPPGEGYAGFYTSKSNSIYMIRSWSVQRTRSTILHETTHYYMRNFLPGGGRAYPQWFHEGLAEFYENHIWIENRLEIGVPPRIQTFDAPNSALQGLLRFREYLKKEVPVVPETGNDMESGNAKGGGKRKGEPETPIDPDLIQPFLDTMFTPEIFQRERIVLKNPNDAIAHRYAMYQALGRFLLAARSDHLGAMLRQIALWEKEKSREFPRANWFNEAWKKVAREKPITVEEVGRWLQKNQLPFQWSYGDWQDLGNMVAGKAQDGKISILSLRRPEVLPSFTAFPRNTAKFQVGVVINFVDKDNYGVIAVDQDGDVLQMQQRQGEWIGGKKIGKTAPIAARNNPYGNTPAFQFAVTRQGGGIVVLVNKTPVGTYPAIPKGCCGFFIASTEATFGY